MDSRNYKFTGTGIFELMPDGTERAVSGREFRILNFGWSSRDDLAWVSHVEPDGLVVEVEEEVALLDFTVEDTTPPAA